MPRWQATPTDVANFKEWLGSNSAYTFTKTDGELKEVIEGAMAYIQGRKWSCWVVSQNFLADGYYHP